MITDEGFAQRTIGQVQPEANVKVVNDTETQARPGISKPVTRQSLKILYLLASASLLALIALSLAWELWLAPLHAGGSWLVLKVVPLLLAVVGILKGKRYTYQWASMLILFYFIEGIVRTFSNTGLAASLARVETGLALVFFIAAMFYAKFSVGSKRI